MKCIDDEIPFEIPDTWCWARLGVLAEIIGGYAFPSQLLKSDTGIRVIRISDINENGFTDTRLVRYNGADVAPNYYIHEGDILMAMTGGTVGKSLYVSSMQEPMLLNQRVAIIRNRFIHADYLNIVIKAPHILTAINERKNSTNDNISMVDIWNFIVPLPPISGQKRIVLKYNEILQHIEKYAQTQYILDSLNSNIKETLRKSILQEAIQGKLVAQNPEEEPASILLQRIQDENLRLVKEGKLKKKDVVDSIIFKGDDNKYYEQVGSELSEITDNIPFDIPNGWEWCRLRDICYIFTGATFKKEDANTARNEIRILRGGNILPYRIVMKADDIFLAKENVKEAILLRQDDIITPAVTSLENIGKMARVKENMSDTTVGGFVFVLRPHYRNSQLSKFLLFLMSSPSIIEYIKSITNKSGQAFYNIGKERLAMTLIPIPPIAEQQRIADKIEELFSSIKN